MGLIIALDYDGTYDEDPGLWDQFIYMCGIQGHKVYIVTMRHPEEPIELIPEGIEDIIYTAHNAKAYFCKQVFDLDVDIWIDDKPLKIFEDYDETAPETSH